MSATVQVLSGRKTRIQGRILLDSCSTTSFVTKRFVKRLQLKFQESSRPVKGFSDQRSVTKGQIKLVIFSRFSKFQTVLQCLVVEEIARSIPSERFPREMVDIPSDIRLADPQFHIPRSVDILVASGPSLALLDAGQMRLSRDNYDLYLQNTKLGWVIVGGIDSERECGVSCSLVELNSQLAKFWELEEINVESPSEKDMCELHYISNTTRNESGRYVVRLPFKNEQPHLGDSRSKAFRQFKSLLRKFQNSPTLGVEYSKVMQGYLDAGHMTLVTGDTSSGYFLPHHAVVKLSSTTTKTRVVFNASAKTVRDTSLNDALLVGPTIQPKLYEHLLRFRSYSYVLTADIEQMNRQILIHPDDRKYQRLFWLHSDKIRAFQLNTVTFGVASAPFFAIRTIHKLADDERDRYPKASDVLKNNLYVDDLLTGTNSLDEILSLRDEIIDLLSKGGFLIRKWSSNHKHALDNVSERIFNIDCAVETNLIIKTLGMTWNSQQDHFTYTTANIEMSLKVTKRSILSNIAKIFDPLGLLGPVVIKAKLFMQKCWKLRIGWDEPVDMDLYNEWKTFVERLSCLNRLTIPRHLILTDSAQIEIHGFCDASAKGYGACLYISLYIRSIDVSGSVLVRLACAKTRVAPVKPTTIPKLELCGALLLVRLFIELKSSFNFQVHRVIFWSDSEIVLHWLKRDPSSLKVFEKNRVSEIQNLREVEWRYVAGSDNAADVLSRGQNPSEIVDNSVWFTGMPWLYEEESNWPKNENQLVVSLPGMREPACLLSTSNAEQTPPFYKNCSSYFKLINIVAFLYRFCYPKDRSSQQLTVPERCRAEKRLLFFIQHEQFGPEIRELQKTGFCKSPRLAAFNPYLDTDGLLRVGGRLKNALVSESQKHPILLPSRHHVTDLIIREVHLANLHSGVQSTLYNLRMRFWLLDGKGQVRKIIRSCTICFRHRPVSLQAKMADLPRVRVEQSSVFKNVGTDYFGPINIKEKKFRNCVVLKAYGCVFICMVTKATHIEIVSDLTTEVFLEAFSRFIARRGMPSHVYSDNGTNFVGANNELQKLFEFIDSQAYKDSVRSFALRRNITWHFNPPLTPHFGGLWEAAVKSYKHHLKRVMGGQLLTFEQLNTLCIDIEDILNSRPLWSMSADPNDPAALTPSHYLIGRSLTMFPNHDLTSIPDNRLSAWRFVVKARQDFWKRWHLEYLHELQRRQKWLKSKGEVKVGSVVVIIEKNQECFNWPLGKVIEVFPGSDGVIRVVSVRTETGIYKRNITSLCVLPNIT